MGSEMCIRDSVFREQKSRSGQVWVLLFGVTSGSETKNDREFLSGFGYYRVKVRVGSGSGSTFRDLVGFR